MAAIPTSKKITIDPYLFDAFCCTLPPVARRLLAILRHRKSAAEKAALQSSAVRIAIMEKPRE
jgi:hypothetical protein